MPDSIEPRLDRYLAGELSVREQRELAQSALDDPALFETLTAAAALKATVLRDSERDKSRKPRRFAILGGLLAAAAAISFVMVYRSPSVTSVRPATSAARAPAPSAAGATGSAAAPARPVILTARLEPVVTGTTAFRGVDDSSRLPKSAGEVRSVEDGEIDVDLGSLDGVEKGTALRLFRGGVTGRRLGTLTVVTVFREHSRGQSSDAPQLGDTVEVPAAVHVAALSQQVAARIAAGDITRARALAERALSRAQSPEVAADVRRKALDQLGTLEYRDGAIDLAAGHLRLAVDELDVAPIATGEDRARILNELGAVLIDRGDYAGAETALHTAQPAAIGIVAVHVANNLGAIAALRGDRAAADALYRSALALAGSSPDLEPDRRAVQKNLETLNPSR